MVVTLGLLIFAFTTVLGWSFYGERCTEYLFGVRSILPFRMVWVVVVVVGCLVGDRGVVWGVADTLNGLMAIPNLIALLLLSGTVFQLSRSYFKGLFQRPTEKLWTEPVATWRLFERHVQTPSTEKPPRLRRLFVERHLRPLQISRCRAGE